MRRMSIKRDDATRVRVDQTFSKERVSTNNIKRLDIIPGKNFILALFAVMFKFSMQL